MQTMHWKNWIKVKPFFERVFVVEKIDYIYVEPRYHSK